MSRQRAARSVGGAVRTRPGRLCWRSSGLGVAPGQEPAAPTDRPPQKPPARSFALPWPQFVGCACLRVAVSPACVACARVPACPCVSVPPLPSAPGHSVLTRSLVSLPGPVLVSLRPGSQLLSHQPLFPERPLSNSMAPASPRLSSQTGQLAAEDARRPRSLLEEKATRRAAEQRLEEKKTWFSNGFDIFECPPPKTENEV